MENRREGEGVPVRRVLVGVWQKGSSNMIATVSFSLNRDEETDVKQWLILTPNFVSDKAL